MALKTSITHKSVKHAIVDKANSKMVISVALATFVLVFCIFATKALFSQSLYHGRLIGEKEEALNQLEENKELLKTLNQSYISFVNEPENILGGNPTGSGALDGNNAVLVLDALPSKYDYPALSSSFEKILRDGGYTIDSIGGLEDVSYSELSSDDTSQSGAATAPPAGTADIAPIEIPYSFSVTATTERTEDLLRSLEQSIRPMYIDNLQIQVGDNSLGTQITLHTYFTLEKTFTLGSKEVK